MASFPHSTPSAKPPDPPDGRNPIPQASKSSDPPRAALAPTFAPLPAVSSVLESVAAPPSLKPSVSSGERRFAPVAAGAPSFASVVAGAPSSRPRFSPLKLPNRMVSSKDGKPSISFTATEIAACEKRFEHSIVAKFTVGRPSLSEIQKTFQSNWVLTGRASISDIWDGRHILVILDSDEDVRTALSTPLNKVGHAFFRLFRWSPDYNPKRESTVTTIRVRLPGLPLSIYGSSFVSAIISTFGFFVSVDDRTKACSSLKYARACVELDVTKPIPEAVWINMPDNKSYWQPIVVESKLSYCNRCRVHGHSYDQCRKRRPRNRTDTKVAVSLKVAIPSAPDVGEDGLAGNVEDDGCFQIDVAERQDMSTAMVIFEGVVPSTHARSEKTEIVPPLSPADVGQSSQADQVLEREKIAEQFTRSNPEVAAQMIKAITEDFDLVKDDLAKEGVFRIPKVIDAEFVDILYKAKMNRVNPTSLATDSKSVSPPISEWITKRKKKGKKSTASAKAPSIAEAELSFSYQSDIPSPSPVEVRRSSRVGQSIEVKNSDFKYYSKGR